MSPDTRKHRGPHPNDRKLFAADHIPLLRAAVGDLSWLLTRNYTMKGALKLVGDKYALTERQRLAISRAACSDQGREHRARQRITIDDARDNELIVDGFNLIITIEAALSGGLLLICRDGCIRDLSSVHGSYRSVNETEVALGLIGDSLETLGPMSVTWILDRPISNSGRLAQRIREIARQNGWNWSTEVTFNPDAQISASGKIVISSDSHVLDQAARWLNLNRFLIEKSLAESWLIDLS